MTSRRAFIRSVGRCLLAVAGFWGWATRTAGAAAAEIKKRILPRETDPGTLSGQNPEYLDTRHLKIMPMESFGTMGDVDLTVDTATWRLAVEGAVEKPLRMRYDELLQMPAIEKNVLLVCPGFFSYHARWTGVSIQDLMKMAGVSAQAETLTVAGLRRHDEKTERFQLARARTDEVFLAYAVNGKTLPQKHGFPLRVVADGQWGADWVKYVTRIRFD